jgi:plasmid stabilization system protein ParE
MIVLISDDAEIDIADGVAFYDQHGSDTGNHFCNSILEDVQSLAVGGGVHAKRFGYHCKASGRFPYAIYYTVDEATVLVVAVLDERRDPDWIERRLARG